MTDPQRNKEKYFTLFSCCIPVKGAARTAVCDIQRNDFILVPNIVHHLLTEFRGQPIADILAAFEHKHDDQIREYFDYLEVCDMGFYSEEAPDNFPELSLDYRHPNPLANCILERDEQSTYDLGLVSSKLSSLFCNYAELRNYHALSLQEMKEMLSHFQDSTVRGISLIVGYHPDHEDEAQLRKFLASEKRVYQLLIHGHPNREESIIVDLKTSMTFTSTKIESDQACGMVAPHFFRCTTSNFVESHHHNSCLHRKVSVDKNGLVCNCPSLPNRYGHISEVQLAEVIDNQAFQKLWNVTKDDVEECKDCEFRYICHDCRAHLKNPEDALSKPAKCTYNPYEGTWETSQKRGAEISA